MTRDGGGNCGGYSQSLNIGGGARNEYAPCLELPPAEVGGGAGDGFVHIANLRYITMPVGGMGGGGGAWYE